MMTAPARSGIHAYMYRSLPLVALVVLVACKKDADAPASATGSAAPAPGASAEGNPPAPSPTPAPPVTPPPAPVKMTADELRPKCDKIFTADVIAKSHGADKVEAQGPQADKPLAICQFSKGADVVGSVTVACNPDLDVTTIEKERAAMTKAKDMPAGIGRGGYRLSNAFFFNDDETPCRINANFVNPPADEAAMADALRAITAAITPASLKP